MDPASRTKTAVVFVAEAGASNASMDSELFTCRKPAVVPLSPSPARQRRALSSAEHNAFCVYRHVLLTKQLVPITALFGPR